MYILRHVNVPCSEGLEPKSPATQPHDLRNGIEQEDLGLYSKCHFIFFPLRLLCILHYAKSIHVVHAGIPSGICGSRLSHYAWP